MQNVLLVVVVIICALVIFRLLRRRPRLSPEEFMAAVRQRIASDHLNVSIKAEDSFTWTLDIDGREQSILLDNLYARCSAEPDLLASHVDNYIRAFASQEDTSNITWDQARPRLLPSLKPTEFIEETRKLPGAAETVDDLVMLDYDHGLKILIAIDSEMTMSYATRTQAVEWGASEDELQRIAIENLAKLTGPLWAEANERAQQTGLFAFATQDGYDAARVLLPDFYERASRALGSEKLFVGIPNRDFLGAISADASWKDKFIKQTARDAASYDHAILGEVFTLP